jgi:TPR repeat protein
MKPQLLKAHAIAFTTIVLSSISCWANGAEPSMDSVSTEIAARLEKAPVSNSKNLDERCWSNSRKPELTQEVLAAALELRSKAFAGDSEAQRHLAFGFLNSGRDTEYFEWMYKSASSGNREASKELGIDYSQGTHVKKDSQKSLQFYLAAAEKGDCEAQEAVAQAYETGEGVAVDELESTKWLVKASASGSASAQWSLAEVYLRGSAMDGSPLPGFEKNVERAITLLKSSCEGDCEYAQRRLGSIYLMGQEGITKDTSAAIILLRTAAEHGDGSSQYLLGQVYAAGAEGVLRDYIEAYRWLNIAQASHRLMSSHRKKAADLLGEIEAKMTPVQIEQAQKLSKAFKIKSTKSTQALFEELSSEKAMFESLIEKVAAVGPTAATKAAIEHNQNLAK